VLVFIFVLRSYSSCLILFTRYLSSEHINKANDLKRLAGVGRYKQVQKRRGIVSANESKRRDSQK